MALAENGGARVTAALQDPPGPIVRTEAQQAANENGFRLNERWQGPWGSWRSATAPATLWIAGAGHYNGPWYVATDHPGVIAECGLPSTEIEGPGLARFILASRAALQSGIGRIYQLAASLPNGPMHSFHERLRQFPSATEAESIVKRRIGQDIFREALMQYWQGRCPLTGITDEALLRASHIVPWAECENDAERLDVHNGLLLSALWDAAFDRGLVSVADDGKLLYRDCLSPASRARLEFGSVQTLNVLTSQHRVNLARHRRRHGFSE